VRRPAHPPPTGGPLLRGLLSGPHGTQDAAREVARACPGGVDVLLNVAGALGSLDLASQTCGLRAPNSVPRAGSRGRRLGSPGLRAQDL
jgi:hypothetical protein